MNDHEPVLPTAQDVAHAASLLEGVAHRTPVLRSRLLDEQVGAQVFLKAENLQRAGAFKFRGAYTALAALPPGQAVVAYSSGNHAQAIALAAREQGRRAVIVMPSDAPAVKTSATAGYGAEIVPYDRTGEDREQIAARIAAERDAAVIPPFDHPDIIAGQGTTVRELLAEAGRLDAVYVPCGGGGLLSGSVLAAADAAPGTAVIGVEPAAGDDVARSMREGRRVRIPVPDTLADGAQTQQVGALTFRILREHGTEIRTVPDEDLVAAMRFLLTRLKTVVEPTGCLGLAAALADRGRFAGGRVGVVLSGGNVDPALLGTLLTR